MPNTFDYVYELDADVLTIWAGERGSPAYFEGRFDAEGTTIAGTWVVPGRWRVRLDDGEGRVANQPRARS